MVRLVELAALEWEKAQQDSQIADIEAQLQKMRVSLDLEIESIKFRTTGMYIDILISL
jgi:hypothetical protein